ncbi:MAG TPA: CrcB family protein [Acidimicrobiales bacterium]|nr:CrcB family protein [Acidimicrobiales bacterium]
MTIPTPAGPFHPSSRSPATLVAVTVGGALGTLARYALDLALPVAPGHFPTATLMINLSGSLLIGLLLPFALARSAPHPLFRPFLVTGILGGWTTYSALAADTATLLKAGHLGLALIDVGSTVVGGLVLVACGFYASLAHTAVRYRRSDGRGN